MEKTEKLLIQNIVSKRKELGLKQKELAKKAKINDVYWNKVENLKRSPGKAALRAVAKALGCAVDDLRPQKEPSIEAKALATLIEENKKLKNKINTKTEPSVSSVVAQIQDLSKAGKIKPLQALAVQFLIDGDEGALKGQSEQLILQLRELRKFL